MGVYGDVTDFSRENERLKAQLKKAYINQEEITVILESLKMFLCLGSGNLEALESFYKEEGRYDGNGSPRREIFLLKKKLLGLGPLITLPLERLHEKYGVAFKLVERFQTAPDQTKQSAGS